MGLFTILSSVITGATAAALGPAVGQYGAAKAQSYELERQAEQEKLSAEGRELQRREKLNRALAANVVSQSMANTTGEGTPESIALANAQRVSASEGMEALSDRLKQAQLKRQARATKKAGKLAAAGTLINTGKSLMSLGG